MSSITDRSEPRIATELDAIVRPERGRTWACRIRDFCGSGMLLEGAEMNRAGSLPDPGVGARIGDEIHIHFSVPGETGGGRNYRLKAEVKRVMENAIGVFFPNGMAMHAFQALRAYTRSHRPADRETVTEQRADDDWLRLDAEDARQLTRQIRRLATRALPPLYEGVFERVSEELIVLARDAGSNARQNQFFEALNIIEGGAGDVTRQAVRQVLDHLSKPRERSIVAARRNVADGTKSDGLALVETSAFEDWLAVADIISRAERRFPDELDSLCVQFGMIARPWVQKEIMPFGPTVLAATFDDAMAALELARDIRQLLYECFRDALLVFLRKLLPALRKLMDTSGLVPQGEALEAEVWNRKWSRSLVSASSFAQQAPAEPESATSHPELAPSSGSPQEIVAHRPDYSDAWAPGGLRPGPPIIRPGVIPQRSPAIDAEQPGNVVAAAADAYGPVAPVAMGDMFGTARELVQLRRSLPGPADLPSERPFARNLQPALETPYSPEEIRAALARLRSVPRPHADGGISGVRRRLTDALAETAGAKQFRPEARDALEIVDDLIGSIRGDAILPESVKHWLGDLEMTYGLLATDNGEFLDATATPLHPALQLLNELAELANTADAGEGFDAPLRDQIEGVLAQVRDNYDGEEAVFEQALTQIRPITERQRRAFHGNVRRVVRQSEGTSRLVRARRAVVDALDHRLAARDIPVSVLHLLNPGWRNLLVHSHLRYGPESEEFEGHLRIVDDLVELLRSGVGDAEGIIEEITNGLEDISFQPGRRRQLLGTLREALRGDAIETVRIEKGAVAEALGLQDTLLETDPETPSEDDAAKAEWERCLALARGLGVGAWVGFGEDTGRTRILMIAWVGERHTAFTLVNRKGVKVRDLDLREMVQGLVDDDIEVLDEFDMPLMERAWQNMFQNMHNELAYQATHDPLTGLANRKEFERVVDAAVQHSKGKGGKGVVIFMDLDQFKIINNTCGHDAGDELLRTLVLSLLHELRGVRGHQLARLGGDEFGVLVECREVDECLAVANRLLDSVSDFRFDWKEQSYALTASIGCVPFGDDGRDVVTLLQQADAACYAAKDAGRNQVRIHELVDEHMAKRRGVMAWVARVDQVLQEGWIHLTAQKIAPIRDPGRAKPHYEFLMTVLDDEGNPVSPADFITAAETYDRMPAVDRWVVTHALNWMSLNLEHMETVHGFSINLSGKSLNDPGFCEFVVQQIERTRVPTQKITFEITETAAFSSMDAANAFIARLRELGCTFSLDDFGTGLASYSYLRHLDVDYVKIDGMFVRDLLTNPADYAVVKSVSEIAHFMGKQTVAEFVETTQILDALREIGVDYAQGWGVERPKPLDQLF